MLPWIQAFVVLGKHNMLPWIEAHDGLVKKDNMLPWIQAHCGLVNTQYVTLI